MQRYINFMLCGPRGPPLASVGNVSPVEGIVVTCLLEERNVRIA